MAKIIDSRQLPNNWRIIDDKIGNFRERGLPFRYGYVGAFSQSVAEWFIRVYSNPGDTVLEPFSGRGTTAMQALWHGRNIIANDLSPLSNLYCHSVMWIPKIDDVIGYINSLEIRVRNGSKIDNIDNIEYNGKGTEDDVARLYTEKTFSDIVKLRSILNGPDLYGNGDVYRHEIAMFTRAMMTHCLLLNNSGYAFNGVRVRGADNTNVRAIIKYYEKMQERPVNVNIFDRMKKYITNMGLEEMGIRDRCNKLNRLLISCDARSLNLPNNCADMVVTSPPYFEVINYGMANWLRLWNIDNVGDPLVKNAYISGAISKGQMGTRILKESSETQGKLYDKATDSTGSTVSNPYLYSAFTGAYLKELYRVLKKDACAIIVVGDYGNKKKVDAWRIVAERAQLFGFKLEMVINDELNKIAKSSNQLQAKHKGGKNDYDVMVVLYKGNYVRKNDPEKLDFRWRENFVDNRQQDIFSALGIKL